MAAAPGLVEDEDEDKNLLLLEHFLRPPIRLPGLTGLDIIDTASFLRLVDDSGRTHEFHDSHTHRALRDISLALSFFFCLLLQLGVEGF